MSAWETGLPRAVQSGPLAGENDVLVLCQGAGPQELALAAEGARLAAACGARARCVLLYGMEQGAARGGAGAVGGAGAGLHSRTGAAPQGAALQSAAPQGAAVQPEAFQAPLCSAGAAKANVLSAERAAYACRCAGAHSVRVLNAAACPDDLALAKALARLCRETQPGTVLCSATVRGRAFMPMTAALLCTGLTADCTALSMAPSGVLTQTRPAFGSHVTARIVCGTRPQMATVRPGVFAPACSVPAAPAAPESALLVPEPRVCETGFAPAQSDGSGALAQAELIFAGGLGLGGAEGFAALRALAAACGGCVGATRAAVSAGYAPYAWQIGQTGIVVRPKLYVAVGVSGAVQHLAGMSGAKTVVAVNPDRHAPIFAYADYGIVGGWRETLEALEALLRKAGVSVQKTRKG